MALPVQNRISEINEISSCAIFALHHRVNCTKLEGAHDI